MATTTYSFKDVNAVITPPTGFGQGATSGNGVGEINVEYARDKTAHSPAADGSVMVTKIIAKEGSISISCQQTSPLHRYLRSLINHLENQPTAAWAGTTITISNANGFQDNMYARGVSFQKPAGQPYQEQGQMVTWNFLAAEIEFPAGGNLAVLV